MVGKLLKTVFIYAFVFCMIVLIVLFPRHMDVHVTEYGGMSVDYNFSLEQYKQSVTGYISYVLEEKSLGITRFSRTVEEELWIYISRSFLVILTAFVLSCIVGILKGFFDYRASKRKSLLGNGTTWILQSIPDFLAILIIQWVIIKYFPFIRFFGSGNWTDFILPALLVSIYPSVYIARVTSAAMAAQDGKLYIQVARAKGLTSRVVFLKHRFFNSVGTILAHLPSLMQYILSNLLIVEFLMNFQGAAQRMFLAIDYHPAFGTGGNYEPGIIIGISFFFLCLIMFVQVVSQLAGRDKREGLS